MRPELTDELESDSDSEPAGPRPAWRCAACGEPSPGTFDECWNCAALRPEVDPPHAHADPDADAAAETAEPETGSAVPLSADTRRPLRWFPGWLTLLVGLACVEVWVGINNEDDPHSEAAMRCWGWCDAFEVWDGCWWPVLTSVLVHVESQHLVDNLFWLLLFGCRAERGVGSLRWGLFLLGAAFVTSGISLGILGDMGFGISGVVYAVFGFVLFAMPRIRIMPWWLFVPLALMFAPGPLLDVADVLQVALGDEPRPDPVNNAAHLSGLAFGSLVALAAVQRWRLWLCTSLLSLMAAAAVVPLLHAPWSAHWALYQAERAEADGDLEGADVWCSRALELDPGDPYLWTHRGWLRWRLCRFGEAIADFTQAVEIAPDDGYARASRGAVRREIGEHELGIADLKRALLHYEDLLRPGAEDEGRWGWYLTAAEIYGGLGWIWYDLREYAVAESKLSRALEHDSQDWSTWEMRGWVRLEQGRTAEAIEDFDRSLILEPSNTGALIGRGAARHALGLLDGALADFNEVLDSESRDPRAWWGRGAVRRDGGDLEGALRDLERALQINPRSARAYLERSLTFELSGDAAQAAADRERAAYLDSDLVERRISQPD